MSGKKVFLMMILLLTCFLTTGLAISIVEASESPEGTESYKPSAIMVIQSKDIGLIRTLKNRYAIASGTEILDRAGNALTLKALPVPCEAEVTYKPYEYGDDFVLKIVLRKVMPGASSNWSQPMPE